MLSEPPTPPRTNGAMQTTLVSLPTAVLTEIALHLYSWDESLSAARAAKTNAVQDLLAMERVCRALQAAVRDDHAWTRVSMENRLRPWYDAAAGSWVTPLAPVRPPPPPSSTSEQFDEASWAVTRPSHRDNALLSLRVHSLSAAQRQSGAKVLGQLHTTAFGRVLGGLAGRVSPEGVSTDEAADLRDWASLASNIGEVIGLRWTEDEAPLRLKLSLEAAEALAGLIEGDMVTFMRTCHVTSVLRSETWAGSGHDSDCPSLTSPQIGLHYPVVGRTDCRAAMCLRYSDDVIRAKSHRDDDNVSWMSHVQSLCGSNFDLTYGESPLLGDWKTRRALVRRIAYLAGVVRYTGGAFDFVWQRLVLRTAAVLRGVATRMATCLPSGWQPPFSAVDYGACDDDHDGGGGGGGGDDDHDEKEGDLEGEETDEEGGEDVENGRVKNRYGSARWRTLDSDTGAGCWLLRPTLEVLLDSTLPGMPQKAYM